MAWVPSSRHPVRTSGNVRLAMMVVVVDDADDDVLTLFINPFRTAVLFRGQTT